MQLLLVRHAQTHANVARALDTADPGEDLTDLGQEQAQALADRLGGAGIDALWCSPRLRTRRTVRPLVSRLGLDPQVREGLAEIAAGDWEMSTADADRLAYADTVGRWLSGDLASRVPGAETGEQALERMDAVITEAASGGGTPLVVSHGAILRLWCARRVPGLGPDLMRKSGLGNTGLVRLERGHAAADWLVTEHDFAPYSPGVPEGRTDPVS